MSPVTTRANQPILTAMAARSFGVQANRLSTRVDDDERSRELRNEELLACPNRLQVGTGFSLPGLRQVSSLSFQIPRKKYPDRVGDYGRTIPTIALFLPAPVREKLDSLIVETCLRRIQDLAE